MDLDDLKKSEVWQTISKYAEEEKKSRILRILGILKSDNCLTDINRSFAECKGHAESIKALDGILELPEKIKPKNQ